MYKYTRKFVYYARNKREKKSFIFIKIVLKKVQEKSIYFLKFILTEMQSYDIIIIQKEKNLKGGRRKNEKISFHDERAQIPRAMDRCQTCAVCYCMRENGISGSNSRCYVCYRIWFKIIKKWRIKKWQKILIL